MPVEPGQFPSVISPTQEPVSLQQAVERLNEIVGMITGQRGGSTVQSSFTSVVSELERTTATTRTQALHLQNVTDNIATDLTTVTATANSALTRANQATATGSVRLQAETTPQGGAVASYQWQLTATGTPSIGMTARVESGGAGSIAFTASKFLLYDPSFNSGVPAPVFSYSAGKFALTGDVSINGNLVVSGTITTTELADGAATNSKLDMNAATNGAQTQSSSAGAPPITLSVPLTIRSGANVFILGTFVQTGGTAASFADGTITLSAGVTGGTAFPIVASALSYLPISGTVAGTTATINSWRPQITTIQGSLPVVTGAPYTFLLSISGSSANVLGVAYLSVIELSR